MDCYYELKGVAKSEESGIIKSKENIMPLEYQRYGRNKNTTVNSTYINSGEYRNKFDKITDNKDVNRVLYVKAKEMLEHRSGTLFEDMHWIDGDTGKIVASVVDSKTESEIIYSNAVKKAIYGKTNLVTIHSHPQSMPPSVADFNSAFRNDYFVSVVICHDGKIFKYSANQEIDIKLYEAYVRKNLKQNISEYEAQLKALERLKELYQINFEEVVL